MIVTFTVLVVTNCKYNAASRCLTLLIRLIIDVGNRITRESPKIMRSLTGHPRNQRRLKDRSPYKRLVCCSPAGGSQQLGISREDWSYNHVQSYY